MNNENQQLERASVVEIVTYGYKACLKSLWPITRLILPVVLIYAVSITGMYMTCIGIDANGQTGKLQNLLVQVTLIMTVVSWLACAYMYYPVARYIRDVCWNEARDNVFGYLIPQKSLLGCAGLILLLVAAFMPVAVLGTIGFLFLIVPGMMVFTYFYTWFAMALAIYLGNPELGIINAMSETCNLFRGNNWRVIAVGFPTWFIYAMVSVPLFGVHFGLEMLQALWPFMVQNAFFAIAYLTTTSLTMGISIAVGFSSMLFVQYRFLFDLRARSKPMPPVMNITDSPATTDRPTTRVVRPNMWNG